MFATCSEWSNVIFKTHSDLDFSELDRRRVGVRYMCNGVEINYNGAYLDKRSGKEFGSTINRLQLKSKNGSVWQVKRRAYETSVLFEDKI